MGIVDFILNLAGLLLWLNWRSLRFDPLAKRTPATLMGTLRPAAPKKLRRWHLLVFLAALLFLRAVFYRWLAPFWIGKLELGVIAPTFRSDWFSGILLFSFLSFGLTLGIFYVGLLFLSLLSGPEPIHSLVKIPLGRVDGWPRWAKILLPFFGTAVFWWLAGWLLVWLQILPPPVSVAQRLEQSLVIGLGSYLLWKFPAGAILALHLLNSYVYFGKNPVLEIHQRNGADTFIAAEKNPVARGQGGFRAGGGHRAGFSGGGICRACAGFSLRPPAVLNGR
jgi:hypothetical protein